MAVVHAQLLCLAVHAVDECFDTAGQVFSRGDTGIIPGNDGDAFEKLFQRHPGVDSYKHLGAFGAPSQIADKDFVLNVDVPTLESFEDQKERQNFGERGWFDQLIGILFEKDRSC